MIQAPFQITVHTEQLRLYRREGTLLIRLGALANAILAVGRAFRAANTSLGQIRDQVQYTALIASYAVEAGRIIDETSDNLTWQLADAGAATDSQVVTRAAITALRSMLASNSEFLRTCSVVRDQHAFHIDAKPVLRWLNGRPVNEAIILQTVEGAEFTSCLFDASVNVVRAGLPSSTQQPEFKDELIRFATALPLLVHVMTRGFGLLVGTSMVARRPPNRPTYEINLRPHAGGGAYSVAVEIRPLEDSWFPFYVGMPEDQAAKARPELRIGNRADNSPTRSVALTPAGDYPGWWIRLSTEAATPTGDSHYIYCVERPSAIIFGQVGGEQRRCLLRDDWGPRKTVGITAPPSVVG